MAKFPDCWVFDRSSFVSSIRDFLFQVESIQTNMQSQQMRPNWNMWPFGDWWQTTPTNWSIGPKIILCSVSHDERRYAACYPARVEVMCNSARCCTGRVVFFPTPSVLLSKQTSSSCNFRGGFEHFVSRFTLPYVFDSIFFPCVPIVKVYFKICEWNKSLALKMNFCWCGLWTRRQPRT